MTPINSTIHSAILNIFRQKADAATHQKTIQEGELYFCVHDDGSVYAWLSQRFHFWMVRINRYVSGMQSLPLNK